MTNTGEGRSYVDCFNRHDLAEVMACFHDDAVIIDMSGKRDEGTAQIRRFYASQFTLFPDGRCDITAVTAQGHAGMAETAFHGTHAKTGKVVTAHGPEVVDFAGDKITELRDDHRLPPA